MQRMPLQINNPTGSQAWKKLEKHYQQTKDIKMNDLFASDKNRADKFTIKWENFYVDFSKNRIEDQTFQLLLELAKELKLNDAIEKYFTGDVINETENRAVLHTALRAKENEKILVDGENVIPGVFSVKQKIKEFTGDIISGKRKGYTGKTFTDVVNIGIGGSDLGPAMVTEALKFYKNHLNVHFVSNVDGDHVHETIKLLDPETTLFVIVSKTFTTQETLSNATTIKNWFLEHASQQDIAKHFVAVST